MSELEQSTEYYWVCFLLKKNKISALNCLYKCGTYMHIFFKHRELLVQSSISGWKVRLCPATRQRPSTGTMSTVVSTRIRVLLYSPAEEMLRVNISKLKNIQ